jgi:hypothetical protein
LLGHFEACGTVERVTIVCDKMSGRPKGKWWVLEDGVILLSAMMMMYSQEVPSILIDSIVFPATSF